MNDKIDRLIEKFRIWTQSAAERAGTITKVAATKAEELGKIGKLKMEVYQLEREQTRLYTDLGKFAFKALENQEDGSWADQERVKDIRARVSILAQQIKGKEEEIERVSELEKVAEKKTPAKKSTKEETVRPKTTAAQTGAAKGRKTGKTTTGPKTSRKKVTKSTTTNKKKKPATKKTSQASEKG